MNQMTKKILENTGFCTVLALTALMLLSPGFAGAQNPVYLDDGAVKFQAGWDLPAQGTCPADPTKTTRSLCVALRLSPPSCVAPNYSSSSSLCNDVDPAVVDQATCEAKGDRLWNPSTLKCAIVMSDDDRNGVVCALHGGTYQAGCTGAWLMPNGNVYTPPVLTSAGTSAAGAGDLCLRCHNTKTQYNGPRVRDTEDTMFMGHKNMSRKVVVGQEWGGPPLECSILPLVYLTSEACFDAGGQFGPKDPYPGTDSGQDFNWVTGQIDLDPTAGTNYKNLYWIYADWLSAYPRAIYADDPNMTTTPHSPGSAGRYTCARCHTTGWSSNATLRTDKEPHKSFAAPVGSNPSTTPSIVWNGVDNAVFGQVNTGSNVTGDPNKMASWDLFGITCTRCHASVVDTTTNGGVPPHTAPLGMSSHHNNLTVPDFPGGCTATSAQCSGGRCTSSNCATAAGGPHFWYYGYCTDSRILVGNGTTPAVAKTNCETGGLFAAPPSPGMPFGTWITPCSDNNFGTQTTCTTGGGTWNLPTSSCSVAGVCSKGTCSNPVYTNFVNCEESGATWTPITTQTACTTALGLWAAASDVIACEDAGGHWTGSLTQRGQIITNLCMNCHRQEASSGLPYDAANPAGNLKVGPYHGTVPFLSHPHANQFLNSPHAKFTGTFAQIATGKFQYNMSGEYKSFFMTEGEAANTGNGCTGCHDVHNSTVSGDLPFREECTECHNKDLSNMIHSGGVGTPLEHMNTDIQEACASCHMPEGEHLFRINVDAAYSTMPMPAALTGTVNANASPDGNYPGAVWVDLDSACGKCHGGGLANVETTGSVYLTFFDEDPTSNTSCAEAGGTWSPTTKCTVPAANSAACALAFGTWSSTASTCTLTAGKYLRVPTGVAATMTAGQRIEVTGAGSPYYDEDGHTKLNDDFETYVASTDRDPWVTLAGAATIKVVNTPVAMNPVKNNAAYFTKAELAVKAAGIHNDKPFVSFGYTLTPSNTLQLNVDASASSCSGDIGNCDVFVWSWGDATPNTSTAGPTASHTYAAAGIYDVELTVEEYGVSEGSVTKAIRVFALDAPPAAGGTACASIINPNTWAASLTDNSTDANGVKQVTVNWGDGGAISSAVDNTAPYSLIGTVFTRTYLNAATVSIKQTAYDTAGQKNTRTCPPVTLSTFSIGGQIFRNNGTTPVASATVVIKKGATVAKTVYTNSLGMYSAVGLKPGTYSVTVTKAGYTFALAPQVSGIVIGPNATAVNVNAVTP